MERLRALVVDDSLTVRRRLVEALSERPGFEVVGEGCDGRQAIELCLALRPDVVSMDMAMPGLSGLSATEYIMAYRPTPILIVSASTNRGDLFKAYEALAAGAVDVLEKPSEDDADWDQRYAEALRMAARVKVITHLRARGVVLPAQAGSGDLGDAIPLARVGASVPRAVFMGASTGGPGALRTILKGLPKGFPLPIVLVLHLARGFAASLAEWLDTESALRVAFAEDGQPLPAPGQGRVYLAPPDRHLVLREGRLRLDEGPELHSCRPSVDHLFFSAAGDLGPQALGILLTGMGRDGAEGLLALRQAGALTVAQDEATCVVHGMPREAVALGAASAVLSLDEIVALLRRLPGGVS
ncbi:MAG: chemotaxis-specific protein-glutamate methyltransferase CheB [bacterium]